MDMLKPSYEEVDLIKDFNNKKKDTKRTVHITSGVGNPTIVLKKGDKIKKTFNLMLVTAVETSESTNLIQLMSDKGASVMIRTKNTASKKKFMEYLKAGLPRKQQDLVGYEAPIQRADTVKTNNRAAPPTTPRKPEGYQSGVPVQVTLLPSGMTASNVLDLLPENNYDITDGSFRSLISTDSTEESPVYNGWQDLSAHVYDEAPSTVEAKSTIYHQYLIPGPSAAAAPREVSYLNDRIPPNRDTPSPRCPGKRAQYTQEYSELRTDAYTDQKPPPYMSCNIRNIVEPAHPPAESDDEDYEDVPDPSRFGGDKQCYYERVLRSEMTQHELVTRGIERRSLLEMKLKTIESHGVCTIGVPPSLKHSFYQGDRIVNINAQKITDGDFARQIIQTSANVIVQVTTDRLFMAHSIDIKLRDAGDTIGVELDGTKIKYIVPGSPFGKQAPLGLLKTEMCITHINTEFVPLGTNKKQVDEMLREAGLNFFLILQPVEFVTKLSDP